jgi:predicted amidophosphoribosyltransferase
MPYCRRCHLGIPPRETSCPKCGDEVELVVREPEEDTAEPMPFVGVNARATAAERDEDETPT